MGNQSAKSFDSLFQEYDAARANAKEAKDIQEDISTEIKTRLEVKKIDSVDSPCYVCTWKYEKDKETEVFDEEKFAEKDPKKYAQYTELMEEMKAITKKYTKKVVTKGARKLLINHKNESEE